MKFDYCLGNPPYQDSNSNYKFYPKFYLATRNISNCSCLIFPSAWQDAKNSNGLQLLNKPEIKEDPQIVCINNVHNVFPDVSGAEWTNIILWKKDYNNKLNGKQRILTNGLDEKIIHLSYNKDDIEKPIELLRLREIVKKDSFISIKNQLTFGKPYGLRTDIFKNTNKYNLPEIYEEEQTKQDLILFCNKQIKRYLSQDYPLPTSTGNEYKYKVFIPAVWGNMAKTYLGGSYANIYIAPPRYICTETYGESMGFDSQEKALKFAKYLMTKFCRALLFINKYSILCGSFDDIPVQTFEEDFWNDSIEAIDKALIQKYNIPIDIASFIENNIQTKTIDNINILSI